MENRERFSLKKRVASFRYAFRGIRTMVFEEHNARIHLLAVILVTGLGFLLGISVNEWLAISLSIGLVLLAEAMNSAIENLADVVSSGHDLRIGKVKDIAAGGVLITAIISVVVALLIFIPKILEQINSNASI